MKHMVLVVILTVFSIKAFSCECLGPYEFRKKEDLEKYRFIAFVVIDSIYISNAPKMYEHDIFYQADFTILELFKGDSTNSVLINGGNTNLEDMFITSCDIGIDTNEKWVIFAYQDDHANLRIGYCTFSKMYASAKGEKDWQYERGIKELATLREIYHHKISEEQLPDGVKKTFYPDGTIEIEQSFENGLPNGPRTIYYPNGQIMLTESYENGQREGRSIWHARNGRIKRDFKFSGGHPIDTCYYYWFFNGQVKHERIFDNDGNMIQNSSYNQDGGLKETSKIHGETNERITTSYYESGTIRYIDIRNSENQEPIKTTEFFESGSKQREWEYYPNDTTRVFKYWQWTADGELSSNYILLKDKTKIEF